MCKYGTLHLEAEDKFKDAMGMEHRVTNARKESRMEHPFPQLACLLFCRAGIGNGQIEHLVHPFEQCAYSIHWAHIGLYP